MTKQTDEATTSQPSYRIVWYDGHGGKPDYSKQVYPTIEDAVRAAELALERSGCDDVAYGVVDAVTKRRVKQ